MANRLHRAGLGCGLLIKKGRSIIRRGRLGKEVYLTGVVSRTLIAKGQELR